MGCRARAFAATGNYLDEEPFCVYQPGAANLKPNLRENSNALAKAAR
jgi:hypothetical protein